MGVKYKYLDQKINNLVSTQTTKPIANTKFYPRVLNKTNISFTDEETKLLNKWLRYNLDHKNKHWLRNLALEAEAAATLLPVQGQPNLT